MTCILCGATYEGMGHNPEPLANYDDGRCCDVCNDTRVIPARIGAMRETLRRLDSPPPATEPTTGPYGEWDTLPVTPDE